MPSPVMGLGHRGEKRPVPGAPLPITRCVFTGVGARTGRAGRAGPRKLRAARPTAAFTRSPCYLQRQRLRATRVPVAVGERCPLDEVRDETRSHVFGASGTRSSRA
ncbi:hypothetical protein Anae109_0999 [Anaeromyxobacter sp. Fw109-5]|nr:hypothetical protein Anae109_0999 [Anaeromyxobacter sp. Fw109-5]